MNTKVLVLLVFVGLLALQVSHVEGICYTYVCRRRCVYSAPRYEEYAFRYLWTRACGQTAVEQYGIKACCVTWGDTKTASPVVIGFTCLRAGAGYSEHLWRLVKSLRE